MAVLLAVVAFRLAFGDRHAPAYLGWTALALLALIVVFGWLDSGFRFIWSRYEGEFWTFCFFLLVSGVALLASAVARAATDPTRPSMPVAHNPALRVLGYLLVGALVVVLAFTVGVDVTSRSEACVGECDLVGLSGLAWAAAAAAICLAAVVVAETVLWSRRRRER